jgi:hypothetical protein
MKSTIAAKHATAKQMAICPQSISLPYERLEAWSLDQIAARLIDARQATGPLRATALRLAGSRGQPGRAAPEHSLFDTRIRRFVPAVAE